MSTFVIIWSFILILISIKFPYKIVLKLKNKKKIINFHNQSRYQFSVFEYNRLYNFVKKSLIKDKKNFKLFKKKKNFNRKNSR